MSIAFLHSILRNIILYFGPIIIISSSLILSIGNIVVYKQALNQNNFYKQVANEFNNTKPNQTQDANIQDEFYTKIIWNNIDDKLNSPDWLKTVSETNLERANLWLIGKNQVYEPYLPLNVEKPTNPQDAKKPSWLDTVKKESTQLVEKLQNQTKELNLPKVELPNNLDLLKLPVDVNSLNPVYQVNQTWVNFWIGLRSYYWTLQNIAWTAITIYTLVLLGLIITSVFFGKNLLTELGTISQKLGINLTVSTILFILSTSGVFLLGAVIKSFIPSSFLIGNITGIINWQIIWVIVSVMAPALALGVILTIGGLLINILSFSKHSR